MGSDFYEPEASIEKHRAENIPRIGIGRNTSIENAIIDKNARIGDGCVISPAGQTEGPGSPALFYPRRDSDCSEKRGHSRTAQRFEPRKTRMNPREFRLLQKLASIHGIQTTYKDMSGKRCRSCRETLIALLKTFGVSAEENRDIAVALDKAVEKQWQEILSPVHVVWEGRSGEISLSLPEKWSPRKMESRLVLEDGTERKWTTPLERCAVKDRASFASGNYVRRVISLPRVPIGYHRYEVRTPGGVSGAMIISAPQESYVEPGAPRIWGLFLPMYACHSERSWGAGDLGDWRRLCQWSSSLGAHFIGTLPLMPALP